MSSAENEPASQIGAEPTAGGALPGETGLALPLPVLVAAIVVIAGAALAAASLHGPAAILLVVLIEAIAAGLLVRWSSVDARRGPVTPLPPVSGPQAEVGSHHPSAALSGEDTGPGRG